jgi:hypothetical protein
VSAELEGKKFEGAQGLGALLRDDPRVPATLVRNVYAYGVGHKTDTQDDSYLSDQAGRFTNNGYRLPDLMAQIASSPEFFKVVVPAGVQRASSTPAATSSPRKESKGVNR